MLGMTTSLNKEQFCEALSILLNKGSRDEVSLPDMALEQAYIHTISR